MEMTNQSIQNALNNHEIVFFVIVASIGGFMTFIITRIIIPNTNKSSKFIKDIVSLYKTLPSSFFHDQFNEYMDQIQEVYDNYDIEDNERIKNDNKSKHTSTSRLIVKFLFYCLLVTFFLLLPFFTLFKYKPNCSSLVTFLSHSSLRCYYVSAVNLFALETYVKDRYYYSEGEELALLTSVYENFQKVESNIKSGKYGGKPASGYPIFDSVINSNGCVRSSLKQFLCDSRNFTNIYTEELSNSPLDYIIVEYLNKLREFINNPPTKSYDLTDPDEIALLNIDISNNEYLPFFQSVSEDIVGHNDRMSELAIEYLTNEISTYIKYTLLLHAFSSTVIFVTFFIFVTFPIKKQLRVIDTLTNVTFSIPSSVYNSSPKMK
eukprot:jgi/Orpsp1_1/1184919/evm.model.c7180000091552.1